MNPVYIDDSIGQKATLLFSELGLDLQGAVNIFLRQCLLRGGLPFNVELPRLSAETLEAMEEARRISRDPNVKAYTSMEELKEALEDDTV